MCDSIKTPTSTLQTVDYALAFASDQMNQKNGWAVDETARGCVAYYIEAYAPAKYALSASTILALLPDEELTTETAYADIIIS